MTETTTGYDRRLAESKNSVINFLPHIIFWERFINRPLKTHKDKMIP